MTKLEDQRLLNELNRMNELRKKVEDAAINLRNAKMELAAYKKQLQKIWEDNWNQHLKNILQGKDCV